MNSKKPSGSEYKKRRIAKEVESVRNTPKIQSFFTQGWLFCDLSVFSRYRNCVFVYSFSFEDITTSEISTTSDSKLSVTSDLQEELKSSLSIENEAPEEMEIDESLLSSNTSTLTSGQYFHFYKQLFF